VLTCVRAGLTVDEIGRRLPCNAERFLKRPAEMRLCFAICRRRCTRPALIAERCAFTLADLGYTFPALSVPEGETQQSFLEKMTWQGAADATVR